MPPLRAWTRRVAPRASPSTRDSTSHGDDHVVAAPLPQVSRRLLANVGNGYASRAAEPEQEMHAFQAFGPDSSASCSPCAWSRARAVATTTRPRAIRLVPRAGHRSPSASAFDINATPCDQGGARRHVQVSVGRLPGQLQSE